MPGSIRSRMMQSGRSRVASSTPLSPPFRRAARESPRTPACRAGPARAQGRPRPTRASAALRHYSSRATIFSGLRAVNRDPRTAGTRGRSAQDRCEESRSPRSRRRPRPPRRRRARVLLNDAFDDRPSRCPSRANGGCPCRDRNARRYACGPALRCRDPGNIMVFILIFYFCYKNVFDDHVIRSKSSKAKAIKLTISNPKIPFQVCSLLFGDEQQRDGKYSCYYYQTNRRNRIFKKHLP